jgi:hypothetical protein
MSVSWLVPLLVLTVSVVAPPRWVAAQQKSPIEACPAVQGDPRRRACPDSLVKRSELGDPIPAGNSKWFTASYNDATDNSPTIIATLPASQPKNHVGRLPQLNVRCKGNHLNAWLDWGQSLESGTSIVFRLDDRSVRLDWQFSSDHKASYFLGKAKPFIEMLLEAERFTVQVAPRGQTTITADFVLRGADRTLSPLLRACGL